MESPVVLGFTEDNFPRKTVSRPWHQSGRQDFAAVSNFGVKSLSSIYLTDSHTHTSKMPGISLADTIGQLSVSDGWGPETVSTTTLDGVPYAPYSKGDKLGRMADWTQEGKDREGRGGRQYQRNYRGELDMLLITRI